jgi:co-chaperonin GroES (HSP10)
MLVLQNIEEVKKIGLLWVPSTSKMSRKVDTLGKVLAITWPEHYGDQWIHVGDWVIFGNYSGAEFKFETDENRDNLYRILKPEDIYAVVKSNGRADGPRE